MKVTEDVILDLWPLFSAGEASEESKTLVETYLEEHPEFAGRMKGSSGQVLPEIIPSSFKQEDEMMVLRRTKRLLRLRNFIWVLAIFCSALPFAYGDVSWDEVEGGSWLWSSHPAGAVIAGLLGLLSWAAYFVLSKRLRVTGL